ncbi:uncharacterized protein UV8b_03390 [Ustilaginoidea virens]|uniref:Uncharacterized protein n=1 Tax=Ustilaginoidea virens TaxID=1159556 RepID=A0A8E5HPH9_USTVR|nr:uncharacterized protein UV8b_03390 [Ustilaginoidea virens]QUC19149.1 hypothetical protein UV8b_03390 [Ustilaginoidea virens]
MGHQGRVALPRGGLLLLAVLALAILSSTYLWTSTPRPNELVSTVFAHNNPSSFTPGSSSSSEAAAAAVDHDHDHDALAPEHFSDPAADPPLPDADRPPPPTAESEKGDGSLGKHFSIRPSARNRAARVPGCLYPLLIHVTPDAHCTGALAAYASIVRNVLAQPEALRNRTCVHVTYIDANLTTVEDMYRWRARPNPFAHLPDCAALDGPELNKVVPLRFQALAAIEKPEFMETRPTWLAALNKVHSWGFDLYPRVLIVDADSIIVRDLDRIFADADPRATIVGAPDQYGNCHDRSRLNGGMILLRPSRYFHISAAELLYDKHASCFSGRWDQSEQELLNCICGYLYDGYRPLRPEFQCSIMPLYNSVWPKNYGCSGARVVPVRSIHFTPAPKPWDIHEADFDARPDTRLWKCIRDAARSDGVDQLRSCKTLTLQDTMSLPEVPESKQG